MAIQFSKPPADVDRAVTSKLRLLGEQTEVSLRALGGAVATQVTPTMPHRVYVLGLPDVIAGRIPDDIQPVGWRYILESGGDAVATAETRIASDDLPAFSGFNSGPYVASTVRALDRAANLSLARERALTVRMLRIPALNLVALWLHGDDVDLFTPLEPAPPGVEPGKQYQASELFAALRSEAEKRIHIGPSDLTGG